jgi:GT2 family glycosyltransferase
LLNCLQSVFDHVQRYAFEVWVVDNGSSDDSVAAVRDRYPAVRIIENHKNLGFAAANNKALRQMQGDYALLLNSDALLTPGAVEQLHIFMEENPHAGMVCGQLLNEDGSKQNSIANFPTIPALLTNETILRVFLPQKFPSKRRNYLKPLPVDSCIGACVLVRKKTMAEVGLLDEDYFFYFEETDWAYRMHQQNWGVYFLPTAKIYHLQGKTAKYSAHTRIMFYRSRSIFFKKWHPKTHGLMIATVFLRLLIDYGLNIIHTLFTLGQNQEPRQKIAVYSRVILWHLRGCPD